MALKVLCVAEKPSIAKAVAGHLGGGNVRMVSKSYNNEDFISYNNYY
jgi:DNA topoisomerase IA